MLKVRDFVAKKCFFTTKEGKRGCMVHRSVVLDDGTTIRWNKKGECWKIVGPERFDTAVATSLSRYAMHAAVEKGRMRSTVQEFFAFENFARAALQMVEVDTLTDIVVYLGGCKS